MQLRRFSVTIAHFLTAQGLAMAANLLYGFVCVRALDISAYAKYTILFSFVGTISVLLDVGTSGTLIPLVGERWEDSQLIADYVASIRSLSNRLFLAVCPIAGVAFHILIRKQAWGLRIELLLVLVLMLVAWCARASGTYGAVLLLRHRRDLYYRTQIIGSVGTFACLLALWGAHRLNVNFAIGLNVVQVSFNAWSYRRMSRSLLKKDGCANKQFERQIIGLASPNLPNTIFYALQGQLPLFLLALLGHSSSGIAGLGALGRIGQIFALLSQGNPIVVEPFFARLTQDKVRRHFMIAFCCALVVAFAMIVPILLFPASVLKLLGPSYSGFQSELIIVVIAAAVRFVIGVMWTANLARKFVFWWVGISIISTTVTVQLFFMSTRSMGKLLNVLDMNLACCIAELLIVLLGTVAGLSRGPKKLASDSV